MLHRPAHRHSDVSTPLIGHGSRLLGKHCVLRLRPRLLGFILVTLAFACSGVVWLQLHPRLAKEATLQESSACTARLASLGVQYGPPLLPGEGAQQQQFTHRRRLAYDRMGADLKQHGLRLGGKITQGLTQQDLFRFRMDARPGGGSSSRRMLVAPVLQPLQVPVRAVVLPLPEAASLIIHAKAKELLMPLLAEQSVWWQDPHMYHSTIYHASNHKMPVPADPAAVAVETAAIAAVAARTCPMQVALERVLVTSTGVLVACWQVLSQGSEPSALRDALQAALPHAPPPDKQLVSERAMLHTTIARLLAPAVRPQADGGVVKDQLVPIRRLAREMQQVADGLSQQLCGLSATVEGLWFVEEQDLLALALQGHMVRHSVALSC